MRCPTHGVVVEAAPFARPGAHLTRDLDDLLAWLAMDKTAVGRLCRVSWRTVGRACERVVADGLDPDRLDGLFRIGVDEISWRKQHKYLTLVVDHDRGKVIWGPRARTTRPSTPSSTSWGLRVWDPEVDDDDQRRPSTRAGRAAGPAIVLGSHSWVPFSSVRTGEIPVPRYFTGVIACGLMPAGRAQSPARPVLFSLNGC